MYNLMHTICITLCILYVIHRGEEGRRLSLSKWGTITFWFNINRISPPKETSAIALKLALKLTLGRLLS